MMKYFLCSFFLLYSCAHQQQTEKSEQQPEPITYDAETEKEFSLIEMEEKQALEYYRKLRQTNWDDYKSQGTRQKPSYSRPKRKPRKVVPKPKPRIKELTFEQKSALEIEIGQNLAYFCMKNRKDKRFQNEADCQAYTQDRLLACEQEMGTQYHPKIVQCLKRKL